MGGTQHLINARRLQNSYAAIIALTLNKDQTIGHGENHPGEETPSPTAGGGIGDFLTLTFYKN